jgi:hypothetical protein
MSVLIRQRGDQKKFALWAIILLIIEWTIVLVTFFLEGVCN